MMVLKEHPAPWGSSGLQVQDLAEPTGIQQAGCPDNHWDLAGGEGTKHHA